MKACSDFLDTRLGLFDVRFVSQLLNLIEQKVLAGFKAYVERGERDVTCRQSAIADDERG